MKKKGYGYKAAKESVQLVFNCEKKVISYLSRIKNNQMTFNDKCDEVYDFYHAMNNEDETSYVKDEIVGVKLKDNDVYISNGKDYYLYTKCNAESIIDVLLLIENEIDVFTFEQIFDKFKEIFNDNYNTKIKKEYYQLDNEYETFINKKADIILQSITLDVMKTYPLIECSDSYWEDEIKDKMIDYIKTKIKE